MLHYAPQILRDFDGFWGKGAFEDGDGLFGFGVSAHKYVKGCKISFRPGVDAYVRFRQNGHAGYSPDRGEVMQVDVQQGGPAFVNAVAQGALHEFKIVKSFGPPEIQDQVGASEFDAVSFNKMIVGNAGSRNMAVFRPGLIAGSLVHRADIVTYRSSFFFHPLGPPFKYGRQVSKKTPLERQQGHNKTDAIYSNAS